MKPKVVVVGSANTDFVVRVQHLPSGGETVLGNQFRVARGGKGANQAVAAARLGAEVTLVARLGEDSMGRESLDDYRAEGIHTGLVRLDSSEPSGVALIMVSESGENMIAVASGANNCLSVEDVQAAEDVIRQADCLLLQLEVPVETVHAAARLAHQHGVRVILNPAPAQALPPDLYPLIDILTPNETEAAMLAGLHPGEHGEDFLAQLPGLIPVPTLLVTLGSKGACLLQNGQMSMIPAFSIKPVDTTAAGDAFNGALAVALARGDDLLQATRFASGAGALAATRAGAQPSLPTVSELEQFLASAETVKP